MGNADKVLATAAPQFKQGGEGGAAQFSASLRPELRVGLKLWSPLGIQRSCICCERL